MTTQSSQSFTGRLGYGLGRGVRFFLVDKNVALRWGKRAAFAGVIAILIAYAGSVLAGAVVTIAVFFLGFSLWAKLSDSGQLDGPEGPEFSQSSVATNLSRANSSDSLWQGEELDNDPYSQLNIHNSLFHESDFNLSEKD
ncbi:hypothetical protein [Pseudomonas sp. CCC3.1]|uniref:hypothetical protein n=1 Tax=Pseudomonas sp. CCC3.1 TaxID=3048607 RepID=UPI002AC93611|nr:hypothetical protein [Pseudomonas sp. CCC3.1]MEB0205604.1 hypothetical protein [Pseudomonas sp. CCC3.1]WPX38321.1 hypothetical protein RHM56_09150 [Pseudomonas sp. CCC3.1]